MTRSVLALIIVLAGTNAYAKLQITNIQAAYGEVGPEHKSLVYYPGDEILFRYLITGVKTNAKGEVDLDITFQVSDADGKVLLNKTSPTKAVAALGGGSLPGSARATLGEALQPGTYRLRVEVKGKVSGETASFEREVTLKPTAFTSVSQRFFADADRKVASGAGGILGQNLHFRLGVIGFDRSKGRIETHMGVEVLDANGTEVLTRPLQATFKNDKADAARQISIINFDGYIALNRVGHFTLRFNFTDPPGRQNARFEVPIHVNAP